MYYIKKYVYCTLYLPYNKYACDSSSNEYYTQNTKNIVLCIYTLLQDGRGTLQRLTGYWLLVTGYWLGIGMVIIIRYLLLFIIFVPTDRFSI